MIKNIELSQQHLEKIKYIEKNLYKIDLKEWIFDTIQRFACEKSIDNRIIYYSLLFFILPLYEKNNIFEEVYCIQTIDGNDKIDFDKNFYISNVLDDKEILNNYIIHLYKNFEKEKGDINKLIYFYDKLIDFYYGIFVKIPEIKNPSSNKCFNAYIAFLYRKNEDFMEMVKENDKF